MSGADINDNEDARGVGYRGLMLPVLEGWEPDLWRQKHLNHL
jgi:hypothetical protein